MKGTLYGTTQDRGAHGFGTVFAVTMSGKETVLHSFAGPDDKYPRAGLLNVNGTLYGTTEGYSTQTRGTVFSVSL